MSSSHKSEFVTKNDQIKNTLNFNKPEENASNAASGTETSVSGIGTQTAPNANILDKKVEASPVHLAGSRSERFLKERTTDVFLQTTIPFLVAGFGSIVTGLLLNQIQKLPLVCKVPQFMAICPPLQGMKGNLDMTFSSRLSTEAHQGRFRRNSGLISHILMNIALIQAQAVGISLFAALITFALSTLPIDEYEEMSAANFLFLASNSLFAMSVTCMISSAGLVLLVMLAYKWSINPDNVATPLAASLGDLLAVGILIGVAELYYPYASISLAIPISVIAGYAALVPLWLYISHHDERAWVAVRQQGPTFLLAAVLSSGAGVIQAYGLKKFPELTVYQPLITGGSGNRAGLVCARISSYVNTYRGKDRLGLRLNPWTYYTSPDQESRAALLLLLTSIPYYGLYIFVSHAFAAFAFKPLKLSIIFLFGYVCVVFVQIFFLVYVAQVVVYSLNYFQIDPDMHAIPMVTAIGDLVGTLLLLSLFYVLSYGNDLVAKSSMMSEKPTNTTLTCVYE